MKEKDITDHIIEHWDYYLSKFDMSFYKEQFHIDIPYIGVSSRVDILAERAKETGTVCQFNIPIAIECKLSTTGSSRDLVYELQKLTRVREYHKRLIHPEFVIAVLADELDDTTMEYMRRNNIHFFKYEILPEYDVVDGKFLKVECYKLPPI